MYVLAGALESTRSMKSNLVKRVHLPLAAATWSLFWRRATMTCAFHGCWLCSNRSKGTPSTFGHGARNDPTIQPASARLGRKAKHNVPPRMKPHLPGTTFFANAGNRPLQLLEVDRGLALGRNSTVTERAPPLRVAHGEVRRQAVALGEHTLCRRPPRQLVEENRDVEVFRALGGMNEKRGEPPHRHRVKIHPLTLGHASTRNLWPRLAYALLWEPSSWNSSNTTAFCTRPSSRPGGRPGMPGGGAKGFTHASRTACMMDARVKSSMG